MVDGPFGAGWATFTDMLRDMVSALHGGAATRFHHLPPERATINPEMTSEMPVPVVRDGVLFWGPE